jgi:AcrR family transcriptional regulator
MTRARQQSPPSLRDARKHKTQIALRDAALRLFASKGYDATSTEEIAEKAGVSARTFFRYFQTKESVVFAGQDPWFQSLAERYCAQPAALSDCDAMRNAFIDLSSGTVAARAMLRLRERSIATSPTLRGLKVDHRDQNVNQLAASIAARRSLAAPDEACMLLAEIGVLTHHRALERWLAGPADADLAALIIEEFQLLMRSFSQFETGRQVKSPSTRPGPRVRADA